MNLDLLELLPSYLQREFCRSRDALLFVRLPSRGGEWNRGDRSLLELLIQLV